MLSSSPPPAHGLASQYRKLAVVISHPRSGTHLLIDFIRRNFPSFDAGLKLHESARGLTVSLDRPGWEQDLARKLQIRPAANLVLHTHAMGDPEFKARLSRAVAGLEVVYLYPFRKPVSTLRSFGAFCRATGELDQFLGSSDPFFGTKLTVEAALRRHAASWLKEDIHFIDADAMIRDPSAAAQRLALALHETPRALKRRLPRQKLSPHRWAEAFERLRGRESTAVVVKTSPPEYSADMLKGLDARFADLHAQLRARSQTPPKLRTVQLLSSAA